MRNQSQLFLGLFLIVFALYAVQLKKKPVVAEKKSVPTLVTEPTPEPAPSTRIQLLFEQITAEKIFNNHTSGVRVGVPRLSRNDFTITLLGDEIYHSEDFAIDASWNPALDFLAKFLKEEPGLHLEISGFADEDNPKEKASSDYGASALAFSFARAEYLARYFERKHGVSIQKSLVLKGMGAVPQGKKIELRFYFGSGL